MTGSEMLYAIGLIAALARINDNATLYEQDEMSAEAFADYVCSELAQLAPLSPYQFS